MHVYRFKVTTDTIDEYAREIDISPMHTFEDLQKAIIECAPLQPDAETQMLFYTANARWVKLREIGERPFLSKNLNYEEDDIRLENRRKNIPFTHIAVARLRDHIMDPHQKIIFEYKGIDFFVFFIELLKIYQAENISHLPECVNKVGEIPLKPIDLIKEIEIRKSDQKDKVKIKPYRDLMDEASEDEIEEEIKILENDDTFGPIIKGAEAPKSLDEKKKKYTKEEIAQEFGPEFVEMYDTSDSDLVEEENLDEDDDFFYSDDEDDFMSGRSGRGYDDDEY